MKNKGIYGIAVLYYNDKQIDRVLVDFSSNGERVYLNENYNYDLMIAKVVIFEGELINYMWWDKDNIEEIGERVFALRRKENGGYEQSYEDVYYDRRINNENL